jgi:CBS-domain-containing membrane protein
MHRTTVADVMASDVITASPDASFAELARLLHGAGVRAVPIIDPAGVLIGVVSEADLMASAARPTPHLGAGGPAISVAINRRRRRARRPRPSS